MLTRSPSRRIPLVLLSSLTTSLFSSQQQAVPIRQNPSLQSRSSLPKKYQMLALTIKDPPAIVVATPDQSPTQLKKSSRSSISDILRFLHTTMALEKELEQLFIQSPVHIKTKGISATKSHKRIKKIYLKLIQFCGPNMACELLHNICSDELGSYLASPENSPINFQNSSSTQEDHTLAAQIVRNNLITKLIKTPPEYQVKLIKI